jgi:glycosyltransferase involved in cell wall biosynthesis
MTSIVIAAHNEAAVIERCLRSILANAEPDEFDVTVVANGCTDQTAEVAARMSTVRVLNLDTPGKAAALNAGDRAAAGFPRIYLDADIVLGTEAVRALARALDREGTPPLAVVPRRELLRQGRPWPVRGYFAIHSRLPAVREGLFGRGAIALSAEGRSRFGEFPPVVADDLFLDSLFSSHEKAEVTSVVSKVATPFSSRDLLRRLIRVRRGNSELRAFSQESDGTTTVRATEPWAWLHHVVLPHPWLAPAAVCYVAITGLASIGARIRIINQGVWGTDRSTRLSGTPDEEGGLGGA